MPSHKIVDPGALIELDCYHIMKLEKEKRVLMMHKETVWSHRYLGCGRCTCCHDLMYRYVRHPSGSVSPVHHKHMILYKKPTL